MRDSGPPLPGRTRTRFAAPAILMALLLVDPPDRSARAAEPAAGPAPGRLEIYVAVVAPDLTVRAVPKFRLRILAESGDPAPPDLPEVSTGFDGRVSLDLPAGRYRVRSVEPLAWQGSSFTWDQAFDIAIGATTHVELSSDNAARGAGAGPRITDEAQVFREARPSVFVVESDRGHGSGFLVDPGGLILTNYHVVRASRHLAVKLDAKRKYPARSIATDPEHDVAVVRIHPEAVAGLRPLPLAPPGGETPSLIEGERVVAIGSPLSKESVLTTGVVSKIEEDAIISDVNINPGNSGGPLLNLRGEVVGLNTFGLGSAGGPGISGVVRIHLAEKCLGEARAAMAGPDLPARTLLPVVPETPYPAAALREMVTLEMDPKNYHREAGKLDVQFITPPLEHSVARRIEMRAAEQQKKRRKNQPEADYDPKDDFYEWKRHGGDYEPVVRIMVIPEKKMTGGSKAALFFGALSGISTPLRYQFKADFREMKLLRGGTPVTPIHPGRTCQAVGEAQGAAYIEDIGCYGLYQYPPEAFEPGPTLELHIFTEDDPARAVLVSLEPEFVRRIWSDFEPYFRTLKQPPAPAAPPEPPGEKPETAPVAPPD